MLFTDEEFTHDSIFQTMIDVEEDQMKDAQGSFVFSICIIVLAVNISLYFMYIPFSIIVM